MASTRWAELEAFPLPDSGARNSRLLYFERMNRSFSSWLEWGPGFRPAPSLASHTEFACRLPKALITAKWPGGHSSRSKDLTREMWEPKLRWTPEHWIQIRTPRFMLAQSGSKMKNGHLVKRIAKNDFKRSYLEHRNRRICRCLEYRS